MKAAGYSDHVINAVVAYVRTMGAVAIPMAYAATFGGMMPSNLLLDNLAYA